MDKKVEGANKTNVAETKELQEAKAIEALARPMGSQKELDDNLEEEIKRMKMTQKGQIIQALLSHQVKEGSKT